MAQNSFSLYVIGVLSPLRSGQKSRRDAFVPLTDIYRKEIARNCQKLNPEIR